MNPDDRDELTPAGAPDRSVIDALLDGEHVDKEALRAAFDDPDTREYFVDALLLRQLTMEMGPNAFAMPARPPSTAQRATKWLAAAVIVIATAAVGYGVGRGSRVAAVVSDANEPRVMTPAPPAPEPTTVIRFEPGKDWISNVERN